MEIQEDKTTVYKPRWELKAKGSPHPAKRWCHTTAIYDGFLYILGGRLAESSKSKQFVYRVNCETFLCEPVLLEGNPMMRESHSSGLAGDSIHVFFGINKAGEVLNDCILLKIDSNNISWKKRGQVSEIEARESHMSLVLENRFILIYGGIDKEEKLRSDFFLYDLEMETWRRIEKAEGCIQGKVGGTLINIKNQIYLFGGQITDDNQYSNSIYKIQIRDFKDPNLEPSIQAIKLEVSGPRPLPRSQFASVAFKDRYLLAFGGQGPKKQGSQPARLLSDIWAFDTEKQVWEEILPQNSNIFKPRSSFTANVYKQSIIIFGGLVAFKDFRSTDDIFVLNFNLSTQTEKKPLCNVCKSSFKVMPEQEITIEKGKAVSCSQNFNTGFSTISAIANTIPDPFTALGTLLHSFEPFDVEKCEIVLNHSKLMISLKNSTLKEEDWRHILHFYEFVPLIQESDPRIRGTLKNEIRQNQVNYLSYNIKNCCLRLGNELLLSWKSQRGDLQIFLINKFGMYHTMNVSVDEKPTPSERSIILQYLKDERINIADLYKGPLTLCVSSLKSNYLKINEIVFDPIENEIVYKNRNFKDYLQVAFAKQLPFDLVIFNNWQSHSNSSFKVDFFEKNKSYQENCFPDLFEGIYSYKNKGKSLILVYQNNKLMHQTYVEKLNNTFVELHLTKNIEPNLTFSDVQPTEKLFAAIKSVINQLICQQSANLKRERLSEADKATGNIDEDDAQITQPKRKKAVKTNETENLIEADLEFEINLDEEKTV